MMMVPFQSMVAMKMMQLIPIDLIVGTTMVVAVMKVVSVPVSVPIPIVDYTILSIYSTMMIIQNPSN